MPLSQVEFAGLPASGRTPQAPSYAHAHWYFLATLGVLVAGFWGSFYLRSAVHIVRFMMANATIPAPIGPMLALFDLPALIFTAACFGMGLANIRRPAAHKRFMAATVIPVFSPALARLFQTMGRPSFFFALHASMLVTHVVRVALIMSVWAARYANASIRWRSRSS